MQATIVLCDAAVVENGKLHMIGGGIRRILTQTMNLAVVVMGEFEWVEAHGQRSITLTLTDSNGVEIGPKGVFNINFDGNDRPVGEPSPIIVVASFPQLALAPGQYRWVVAWGDNAANRTAMTMEVIDPATFAN